MNPLRQRTTGKPESKPESLPVPPSENWVFGVVQ